MPSLTRPAVPRSKALDLPPVFRAVTLREVGDAFKHAKANAAELGAGTLVFVGRFDLAEFAVVLEPDEPPTRRRKSRSPAPGRTRSASTMGCLAADSSPGPTDRRTSRRNGWCSAA